MSVVFTQLARRGYASPVLVEDECLFIHLSQGYINRLAIAPLPPNATNSSSSLSSPESVKREIAPLLPGQTSWQPQQHSGWCVFGLETSHILILPFEKKKQHFYYVIVVVDVRIHCAPISSCLNALLSSAARYLISSEHDVTLSDFFFSPLSR